MEWTKTSLKSESPATKDTRLLTLEDPNSKIMTTKALWFSLIKNWRKSSTNFSKSITRCTTMRKEIFTPGVQEKWANLATPVKWSQKCQKTARAILSSHTLSRSNSWGTKASTRLQEVMDTLLQLISMETSTPGEQGKLTNVSNNII